MLINKLTYRQTGSHTSSNTTLNSLVPLKTHHLYPTRSSVSLNRTTRSRRKKRSRMKNQSWNKKHSHHPCGRRCAHCFSHRCRRGGSFRCRCSTPANCHRISSRCRSKWDEWLSGSLSGAIWWGGKFGPFRSFPPYFPTAPLINFQHLSVFIM